MRADILTDIRAAVDRAQAEGVPFREFVADLKPRLQRPAWHGIVLPVDHEFWETHFPPNGWRCRCVVTQLSEDDLAERGWKVSPDPEPDTYRWVNRRTGSVHQVPRGIDPGWDRNVGKIDRIAEMQRTLIDKTAAAAGGTDPALKALADAAVKPGADDFGETFGEFLRHATPDWKTRWPVAVVAPDRLKELDMPHDSPAVVTLSGATVSGHRERFSEEFGAEDWARVQRIVDGGVRAPARERFGRKFVWLTEEEEQWAVALESQTAVEVSLVTYFRSDLGYVLRGANKMAGSE